MGFLVSYGVGAIGGRVVAENFCAAVGDVSAMCNLTLVATRGIVPDTFFADDAVETPLML